MDFKQADPKGLIRESYLIEGISAGECRSIFVDWALSLPVGADFPDALTVLISHYAKPEPEHPMSAVMHEGLTAPEEPRRKGGRAARMQQD